MKMEQQQIISELVQAITPELWVLFIQMFVTVLVTLILYAVLKNIAAYISVRFDKEIGKNIQVMYKGQVARVAHLTWKQLILKLENGNDVLIPITKVGNMDWELIRDDNGRKKDAN